MEEVGRKASCISDDGMGVGSIRPGPGKRTEWLVCEMLVPGRSKVWKRQSRARSNQICL